MSALDSAKRIKRQVDRLAADAYIEGVIVALGCLFLGFGDGPGTARWDEIFQAVGEDEILRRAKKMHPEDVYNAGLTEPLARWNTRKEERRE